MLVRAATVDDAEAIGRAHVRAWQAAYRGVMPDEFLDGLDPAERAAMWASQLGHPGPARLVVEDGDGRVVGFAVAGRSRDADRLAAGWGELHVINLDPEVWGRGYGAALLEGAEAALVDRGFARAELWVVRENARARRFYERAGWSADGAEQRDTVLGATVDELRYVKDLG